MGLLGIMLALVAAMLMALVGIVLWPIRMVAHRRKSRARDKAQSEPDGDVARGRETRGETAAR